MGDVFGVETLVGALLYVLAFAAGVGGGLLIRSFVRPDRSRERELERELLEERDRAAAYRERVEKHFDQTAHLFRDLTSQHVALYNQISEGMRELTLDPSRLPPPVFSAPLESIGAGGAEESPHARDDDQGDTDDDELPATRRRDAGGGELDTREGP